MAREIAADCYDVLCVLAKEFNEYVPLEKVRAAAPSPSDAKGDRPGDEFNRRASWSEILNRHGWTVERASGEVTYWKRPGKDRGVSATTGKCKTDGSGDLLYVFSTNAGPFDSDSAYSKFAAYAFLEHGGDFSAAASDLATKGYAKPTPTVIWDEPHVEPSESDDVAGIDDLKKAGAEIRWVWPGWIQRGVVTAVAAQGGTGKTRLMADLVRRLRHERKWPDGTPIEIECGRTIALWVVSDNHHDEMVTLCDAFGISDCVKLNAAKSDPYGGVTLDLEEDFAAMEKRVKAVKPVFVMIDTVGNATDRNLSKQEDAKAFYQPLQLIARRQAVAVMAMTHLNAGGKVLGRRALEKVRTCIRLNAADTTQEAKRRLEIIKTNSLKPAALGLTMSSTGNTYDSEPPPAPEDAGGGTAPEVPSKTKECADWLKVLLQRRCAEKVATIRDEAEKTGYSSKVLYAAQKLIKAEEVEQQGRKWWRLKDDIQNSN